ncbi:uncharacterized protein LOC101849499 [Aplysia californica]|uniref:Uncharacterized protein LOC101849499 n=1 Tax=Aplysia californica TaxID=6500 RepID=A0ABM0K5N3_APLCA|nr:uncharacterized protein LOC101849499 [Aplysia californica]
MSEAKVVPVTSKDFQEVLQQSLSDRRRALDEVEEGSNTSLVEEMAEIFTAEYVDDEEISPEEGAGQMCEVPVVKDCSVQQAGDVIPEEITPACCIAGFDVVRTEGRGDCVATDEVVVDLDNNSNSAKLPSVSELHNGSQAQALGDTCFPKPYGQGKAESVGEDNCFEGVRESLSSESPVCENIVSSVDCVLEKMYSKQNESCGSDSETGYEENCELVVQKDDDDIAAQKEQLAGEKLHFRENSPALENGKPNSTQQPEDCTNEIVSNENQSDDIHEVVPQDSSRSCSSHNVTRSEKEVNQEREVITTDQLNEFPNTAQAHALQFTEAFQKALQSAEARQQLDTSERQNKCAQEHTAGRPARSAKNRLSERIKLLQEQLRQEIASSESRPRQVERLQRRLMDAEEMSASGRGVRRHQRSVSRSDRTSHTHAQRARRSMTPGKRERPFRHWLGVAKCVTPDCRFIISSREDRASLPSSSARAGTVTGAGAGKTSAGGSAKAKRAKSQDTIQEEEEEEGSAPNISFSIDADERTVSGSEERKITGHPSRQDTSSVACAQNVNEPVSAHTDLGYNETWHDLSRSTEQTVENGVFPHSQCEGSPMNPLDSEATDVQVSPVVRSVPQTSSAADTVSGEIKSLPLVTSAVANLSLGDEQAPGSRCAAEETVKSGASDLGIHHKDASTASYEFDKSQTLPTCLSANGRPDVPVLNTRNPNVPPSNFTFVVTCPCNAMKEKTGSAHSKLKWNTAHFSLYGNTGDISSSPASISKRLLPDDCGSPLSNKDTQVIFRRSSKLGKSQHDREDTGSVSFSSTLESLSPPLEKTTKPMTSAEADKIRGPPGNDATSPPLSASCRTRYTTHTTSPPSQQQHRGISSRAVVREPTPYHPRPPGYSSSSAQHKLLENHGRARRHHSRAKERSASRHGAARRTHPLAADYRVIHRAHSRTVGRGVDRVELRPPPPPGREDGSGEEGSAGAGGNVFRRLQLRPCEVAVYPSRSRGLTSQAEVGKVLRPEVAEKLLQKVNRSQKKRSGCKYMAVTAVEDYTGTLPGQLSFRAGQIIKLRRSDEEPQDGLCYGYYRTGRLRKKRKGLFPLSCISTVNSDGEQLTSL